MADANTGAAGLIRVDVSESNLDYANNRSLVNFAFYLIERTVYNYSFANGIGASVDWAGVTNVWSGAFSFDWRGAGQQTTLIASGSFWVQHNPDGSGYVTVQGNMNATGTSGAGGPASVAQGITLTNLKVVPGTPTGVAATRVSDTQTQLNWAQSSASNGQPDTNTIQESINGGAWNDLVTINATNTATFATVANKKSQYRVRGNNSAGSSAYSAASAAIYTTPADPTNVAATKGTSLDIAVSFTPNVGYTEHEHEVWHGVVAGGVTTWDGSVLATLPSGTKTYTHAAPNAAQVHIYRVRAKAGALYSGYATSNSVQLLAAPNKPTVASLPAIADKASALVFGWTHNSVDTTPQKSYEFSWSTNGGGAWSTTGKTASTATTRTIAASSYAANTVLTMRVRTWGSATTGGSDGTGASDWSDLKAVTYKTVPVATIPAPANGSTLNDATLRVNLGFAQAEGASFVTGTIRLMQGGTVVEELNTNTLLGTTLATKVQNGTSYTINARVQDSNGLWSAWAASTFSVTYLAPAFPEVALSYIEDKGWAQVDLGLPAPRTNLATNPSFETASGTVAVRMNQVTNPNPSTNTTGWAGDKNSVLSVDATEHHDLATSLKVVTPGAASGEGASLSPQAGTVSSGSTNVHTGSVWAKLPSGGSFLFALEEYSSINAYVGTIKAVPVIGTGSWQLISASGSPSLATSKIRLYVRTSTTAATTFYLAEALIEASQVLGSYFDGSTPTAGDFTYAWTGTANGSTSVQNAPGAAGIGGMYGGKVFQSNSHPVSGVKSARYIGQRTDTAEQMFFAHGGFNSMAGFELGKTYTVFITLVLPTALSAIGGNSLQVGVRWSGTNNGGKYSVSAPNVPGTYQLRLTATIPTTGVTGVMIQCNQYGPGETYWDDLVVVEGAYDGPYFAGTQSAISTITVTREIDGEVETLVQDYPAASELTFLDTTPTIHGVNAYTVTATSALGAKSTIEEDLETEECRRAFLSGGVGFSEVGVFGANLAVSETLSVASDTVQAAGRTKPIGLYGVETSVQVKVSSLMYEGFGSTIDEMRGILLLPGKACYRDASGRRVFGTARGSVGYKKATRGDLSFTMTETS